MPEHFQPEYCLTPYWALDNFWKKKPQDDFIDNTTPSYYHVGSSTVGK